MIRSIAEQIKTGYETQRQEGNGPTNAAIRSALEGCFMHGGVTPHSRTPKEVGTKISEMNGIVHTNGSQLEIWLPTEQFGNAPIANDRGWNRLSMDAQMDARSVALQTIQMHLDESADSVTIGHRTTEGLDFVAFTINSQ